MLFTFSRADYPLTELEGYLAYATKQDAVVLWQDAVLLAIKYPALFSLCQANCYALDIDLQARDLAELLSEQTKVRSISMPFLVQLTEAYFPQFEL